AMRQAANFGCFDFLKNQKPWERNKINRLIAFFLICLGLPLIGCMNGPSDTTSALIRIESQSLNFGNVAVGQSVTRLVIIYPTQGTMSNSDWLKTLTLKGKVSITGEGFSIVSGGGDYSVKNWNESGPFSYADPHKVVVKFQPSTSGSFTGKLTVTHNSYELFSPQVESLSGVGIGSN